MGSRCAEDNENVGGDPNVIAVHPVIDQHIAANVNVIATVVSDAQRGDRFSQRRILPFGFGHGFTVGRWVVDGEIIDFILVIRNLRPSSFADHRLCSKWPQ